MTTDTESPAVADPKPRRGRRKAATERKPRGPRKPAEYVIQQKHGINGDTKVLWADMSHDPASDTTAAAKLLRTCLAAGNWPDGTYRIVAVKRVIDAKVETQKKVVFG